MSGAAFYNGQGHLVIIRRRHEAPPWHWTASGSVQPSAWHNNGGSTSVVMGVLPHGHTSSGEYRNPARSSELQRALVAALDKVIAIHQPAVAAHVRRIREHHPEDTRAHARRRASPSRRARSRHGGPRPAVPAPA